MEHNFPGLVIFKIDEVEFTLVDDDLESSGFSDFELLLVPLDFGVSSDKSSSQGSGMPAGLNHREFGDTNVTASLLSNMEIAGKK